MEQAKLKLREIIWEITGRCNNKCSYCGSKQGWNEEIDEQKILRIADCIAKYPPESINISGGDPLEVSYNTHKKIVEKLKAVDVQCKIIVNPKSLIDLKCRELFAGAHYDIVKLYDVVGISVNNEEELKRVPYVGVYNPTGVYITNFNIVNMLLFDDICKEVKRRRIGWQIQFTVYDDPDDDRAIYNNEKALNYLQDKIIEAKKDGIQIMIADNANSGQCTAGTASIGILSNGDLVPCLSMRSWCSQIPQEGNLLAVSDLVVANPLKALWETGFNAQRFTDCKCCKDYCKRKILDCPACTPKDDIIIEQDKMWINDKSNPHQPICVYYGVQTPQVVMVYGVNMPYEPIKMSYGVCPSYTISGSSSGCQILKSDNNCKVDNETKQA